MAERARVRARVSSWGMGEGWSGKQGRARGADGRNRVLQSKSFRGELKGLGALPVGRIVEIELDDRGISTRGVHSTEDQSWVEPARTVRQRATPWVAAAVVVLVLAAAVRTIAGGDDEARVAAASTTTEAPAMTTTRPTMTALSTTTTTTTTTAAPATTTVAPRKLLAFDESMVRTVDVGKENLGGQADIDMVAGSTDYEDIRNAASGCVKFYLDEQKAAYCRVWGPEADYAAKAGLDGDIVCWIVFTGVPPAGGDRQVTRNPSYLYSFSQCPGGVQIPEY